MAQELDFTDPEHAAGSSMAAFGLAQLSFAALVTNELIPKAEAENMLKQLIKANEKGSIANEVAAALLVKRVRISAGNSPIARNWQPAKWIARLPRLRTYYRVPNTIIWRMTMICSPHQHERGFTMQRRAVLYLRVSTLDQTTANQERELREVAERMRCTVTHVYRDHGISGTKGRDKRPQFDAMCKAAARREFDLVMAWSVDRLGRSLQDLCAFLGELHATGRDLYLHTQGLDTTTPAGKAMFQMMGVFAEFERSMIAERVRAGLRRAIGEGKRVGRPPIEAVLRKRIEAALAARERTGEGVRVIAKRMGVNVSTVQRIAHLPLAEAVAA